MKNLINNRDDVVRESLEGCSISLLKLDEETIQLWDAPVKTPALRWGM